MATHRRKTSHVLADYCRNLAAVRPDDGNVMALQTVVTCLLELTTDLHRRRQKQFIPRTDTET